MEPRLATGRGRRARVDERRPAEAFVAPARPLLRPAPRSAMFFPLVVVAAVLPGLYALNWWDLNPPGPWWGMRGLAVLEGHTLDQTALPGLGDPIEAEAYRVVALQPPLYGWLEALALAITPDRGPVATVLPSYLAGVAFILLVYAHGSLRHGRAVGLIAALLTAFNRELLAQMQLASPTTLCAAGMVLALRAYARADGEEDRFPWRTMLVGACGLAISLMAVGLVGLAVVPIVALHRVYRSSDAPGAACSRLRRGLPRAAAMAAGLALVIGLVLTLPWHVFMARRHSDFLAALLAPPGFGATSARWSMLLTLVNLVPATVPLGLYGAWRAWRRAIVSDSDDPAAGCEALWVIWLATALLLPAFWPEGPRSSFLLTMLVPLNLLTAEAIVDLSARRISVRSLTWLAPLTAWSLAWWFSTDLRNAAIDVLHGRRPSAAMALGLHFGVDLALGMALLTRRLDHWAKRHDDRRRLVLGGFLFGILSVTAGTGLREVRFRHRETAELLELRDVIVRREHARRFTILAVVNPPRTAGAPRPAGRLRFILRSALPNLAELDVARIEDLADLPPGERLIVLAGSERRLPYSLQSKLDLESLHPGRDGMIDAYATTFVPTRRSARR